MQKLGHNGLIWIYCNKFNRLTWFDKKNKANFMKIFTHFFYNIGDI
jgi:hypothetical protein